MDIYSIPPLLSAIILFILFLMGVFKSKGSPVNLLFSLICLIGCFLNTDKTILTVIADEGLALRISRIDHIFLVFIIPLYLHFTLLVTGYKKWLPYIKYSYIISLLLLPLTRHPQYLTHVKHYSFGFFAISGPYFYFFGALSTVSTALSLYLLVKKLGEETASMKKTRIRYILLSFGLAAFVNHFDILTMSGYAMYPLGNFVFVPMCLLGYSILKHDVMEWKIFLNKGIVLVTLLLISTGLFVGLEVLLKRLFDTSVHTDVAYIIAMVLTFFLVYFSKERVQDFLVQFLQQEFIRNREALRDLSFAILTLHHIEDIKKTVIARLSKLFALQRCAVRMVPKVDETETVGIVQESDALWNDGYRLSIPIHSKAHPSYLLLGEKGNMSLYTGEEVEFLTILANHTALSFDNAKAYKKIRDFSNSLEKLVDERTRALIQSESLAAVGRLAAGVAHELNNPIAGVMSTLEFYIDHMEEKSEIRDDLIFSLNELRRAKDIVKSLLDASRQKDEAKDIVDVCNPLEDALKILYNQYKNKTIAITKNFTAQNSLVMGNGPRLCQVFINIIKNSIDAIGDRSGRITIDVFNEERPPDPAHQGEGPVQWLVCRVSDDGEGIEKKHLKDIFKPFFTTKPQGKGIGLGLFIVHEIIKDHKAAIEVESDKNKGTVFTLSFPCLQQ
ncbi:MAG: Sensor protein ZraS [Syntrophorhabdus sp. PtaU1.Bin058]|nr:MAG: Sensor protein ZraS [Syntrophorhabdus sp. PtaU1.Bin058]